MDLVLEGLIQVDGVIDDSFCIGLMEEYLVQLYWVINEGVNCFGVYQWMFIDNWLWINFFKWCYGFYWLDLVMGEW